MEAVFIGAQDDTPEVILNKEENKFELSGKSLPENVTDFYNPVYKWLEEYKKDPLEETIFHLNIEYFNSASHKAINELLDILAGIEKAGKKVKVVWHFLREDDDMLETGHDYKNLTGLDFDFIGYD